MPPHGHAVDGARDLLCRPSCATSPTLLRPCRTRHAAAVLPDAAVFIIHMSHEPILLALLLASTPFPLCSNLPITLYLSCSTLNAGRPSSGLLQAADLACSLSGSRPSSYTAEKAGGGAKWAYVEFQSPARGRRARPLRRVASSCRGVPSRAPIEENPRLTACTRIAHPRCEPTSQAPYSILFFGVSHNGIHESVSTRTMRPTPPAFINHASPGANSSNSMDRPARPGDTDQSPALRHPSASTPTALLCVHVVVSHRPRAHTHPYLNQQEGPSTHPDDLLQRRRPFPCRTSLIAPPHRRLGSRWSVVDDKHPD
ncbi:hypothetical protein B0H17DRAFT_1205711 [Mycena rosella]|uniref:Uncharacterized protein n=1 Tax=Mycena rosella TaxID=1033263 RepID=A0AAD7GDP1_MYCRO|nr:hypothetical protein B0H17DRAFT_1205711 [Mycena rosella]